MQAQATPGAALILTNGRCATLDRARPQASAVAIRDGRFLAVGDVEHVMRHRDAATQVVDLNGRTAIPGLNDSHIHLIRGGLNYNLELRWEGVPSLAFAFRAAGFVALAVPVAILCLHLWLSEPEEK